MHPADAAFAAAGDGGDDFVADFQRVPLGVHFDVFAEGEDFAGAFVAEHDGRESERVALPFVHVGAAHAAAFDFDEDFVVADRRDRVFAHLNFALPGQHRDARGGGDFGRFGRRRRAAHLGKHLAHDVFDLSRIHFHDEFSVLSA